MADKILIQIQRLGPDFSDYAHCEYINIKIQIHKCRFTNTKTEYKNTQIQIGKFTNKDKTRYPNSDLGPDFCDYAHCPTANSRQMLSKLHQWCPENRDYWEFHTKVKVMRSLHENLWVWVKYEDWGVSDTLCHSRSVPASSQTPGILSCWHRCHISTIQMLTPRGFHNRNADNNSTGQPFTARVAVQSDGRGARGGSE